MENDLSVSVLYCTVLHPRLRTLVVIPKTKTAHLNTTESWHASARAHFLNLFRWTCSGLDDSGEQSLMWQKVGRSFTLLSSRDDQANSKLFDFNIVWHP